jgi:hypothetical protein
MLLVTVVRKVTSMTMGNVLVVILITQVVWSVKTLVLVKPVILALSFKLMALVNLTVVMVFVVTVVPPTLVMSV